jgi:hypothetical protein
MITRPAGLPPGVDISSFCEDRAGNLWMGTADAGGLLRYRDKRFERFTAPGGAEPGWIVWQHLEQKGRLWIASSLAGLLRLDDPAAEHPQFVRYTTADGLSSNNIRCITEDLLGRIYTGTGHGVDRLNVETRRVKHYTVADGLPRSIIEEAFRDHQGALWFGSLFGLSRLVPEREDSGTRLAVYLTGLRIEGVAQRVSELGETNLPQLELNAAQSQVSLEYVGLGASPGEELFYQYRLEGADADWSSPTTQRTVNYANLGPGSYSFMVRAVNANGDTSATPAVVAFKVLRPVWQRW